MEIVAHANLSRTYTAPPTNSSRKHGTSNTVRPPPLLANQSFNSSQYSILSSSSHRSSGTSGSTVYPTPPPPSGYSPSGHGSGENHVNATSAPIQLTDSVINKVADKESSLFQICINLRQRLLHLPNFETQLRDEENQADADTDPVTILWRTFRRGYPLMALYNALNPERNLEVDPSRVPEAKRAKAAAMKFYQACVNDLRFPGSECFIISDLYGDDTTGFVKVAKVVNRVLDLLVQKGILSSTVDDESYTTNNAQKTQRQHIISELVSTERTYVQHLELLQQFKKLVEEKGVINGDAVYNIFLNLNALLDFQRRFLIRVEQTNAQPESEQNWGKLFVSFQQAFKVYEPFIANQKKCEETALSEFDKLKEVTGSTELRQMIESPVTFSSFLLKPFHRLTKYPLLLRELANKGDLDEGRARDIRDGIEAASSILERSNAAIAHEERKNAVLELQDRVEDWKGHRMEGFGELLLYGTYTVLKGESTSKDAEREYKIYLFEAILLCCKEVNPHKQKNKLISKPVVDRNGKPKIQLKGRIFMQNVTETISIGKPGSYTCQIFWKGDPGIENFVIRFNTEEAMKKWAAQVDTQRRVHREMAAAAFSTRTSQTSNSEFLYVKGQDVSDIYAQEDFEDGDGDNLSTISRSTTSDGIIHSSRGPPNRFPIRAANTPPLQLRTQLHSSQGDRIGDSYFSPSMDSPASSRASSSPGVFANSRNMLPNGWNAEEHHSRHTAPAMGRMVPREINGSSTYSSTSRTASRGPSLPPPSSVQSAFMISRMRSASSPDIHNPHLQPRRAHNQQPAVPELPPFPTHIAYASGLSRSQTSSPSSGMLGTGRTTPHMSSLSREILSPRHPRENSGYGQEIYDYQETRLSHHSRTPTVGSIDIREPQKLTPRAATSAAQVAELQIPSQLKVKVHCPSAGSTMTLVVSTNISFQSLKDRIDAKLQRSTNLSLSAGNVDLKYIDEDDFVSIQSDEDVQTAFETWREQQRNFVSTGQMFEIELYVQE